MSPVLQFTISELKQATEDFSPGRLIGEGGYGQVYWGLIRSTKAAIKVLTEVGVRMAYIS